MSKKPARYWKSTIRRAIGWLLLVLVCGCNASQAERSAVAAVAAARCQALTSHDLPGYLTLVSPAYSDKGLDYSAKVRQLASTFQGFPRINFRIDQQKITISGNAALIEETYTLRTTVKGEEMTLRGEETLRLRKEPGGWKIVGGL